MRTTAALLLMALLSMAGCSSEVPVERLVDGEAVATGFAVTDVSGERDGDRTAARIVFEDGPRRLVLDITLAYDPQPVLARGEWTMGDESGPVQAEVVRFVGGQGEGPSVGGVYRLDDLSGASRFRVRVPLTRIESSWNP